MRWYFEQQAKRDTSRDSVSDGFFDKPGGNTADALVRESIQNSLDADLRNGKPVVVRFFLSGEESGAPPDAAQPYFREIEQHFAATGNGLSEESRPDLSRSVPYLVIEDFNTKGLEGDTSEPFRQEENANGFHAFFRAEGENAKTSENKRGTWGIGKAVFPRSSRCRTFFGLTRRRDEGHAILMGRCILKHHRVKGETTPYKPDGYFGHEISYGGEDPIMPITDEQVNADFARVFNLARRDETGLSIVVPWYAFEDLNAKDISRSVINHWLYSLLSSELEVRIEQTGIQGITINAETVDSLIGSLPDNEDLVNAIALFRFALSTAPEDSFLLGKPVVSGSPNWKDIRLDEGIQDAAIEEFNSGKRVAFRIPTMVGLKGTRTSRSSEASDADIRVFLVRDDAFTGQPVFIRDGLHISDVRRATTRQVRSLVIVKGGRISELLAAAENASHTEWSSDRSAVSDRFTYARAWITFVTAAPKEIVRYLSNETQAIFPDIFNDVFSVADPDAPQSSGAGKAQTPLGEEAGGKPDLINSRPPVFSVNRVKTGFRLAAEKNVQTAGKALRIRVAYDVRKGNAFSQYRHGDFDLQKNIMIEPHGLALMDESLPNERTYRILSSDYSIAFSGFDENRDVVVDAKVISDADGENAA